MVRNASASCWKKVFAGLLILSALILLFWRLDDAVLERDEADTAVVASDMVTRASWVPRYLDGPQLLAPGADGHDFNRQFLPSMQSWLEYYVDAVAFRLFGVSTEVARFPFALLGIVSLIALYRTGRALFGAGWRSWLPMILALFSIYSLTVFREARYYSLVYLLSSLIILDLCGYIRFPERARSPWLYVRLGLYGLFLYYSNYLSFAGMWFSLAVFAILSRDRMFQRRLAVVTAALAIPLAIDFGIVHSAFLQSAMNEHAHPLWWIFKTEIKYTVWTVWCTIPLLLVIPLGIYVFRRGTNPPATLARAALLSVCVVCCSIVFETLLAREHAESRYYLQILPAMVVLQSILIVRLSHLTRPAVAACGLLVVLIWPNLSFYTYWDDEVVERQLLALHSMNEPLLNFLREHARPNETYEIYPDGKAQIVDFYLPGLKWVGALDSSDPRVQRYRGVLPASAFDDYNKVDWIIVWYSPWDTTGRGPRMLTPEYIPVWEGRFRHPQSFWDLTFPRFRNLPRVGEEYRVYRKGPATSISSPPALRKWRG